MAKANNKCFFIQQQDQPGAGVLAGLLAEAAGAEKLHEIVPEHSPKIGVLGTVIFNRRVAEEQQ